MALRVFYRAMKAVFLDYGTVSFGDLDATALRNAVSELHLYDLTGEPEMAGILLKEEWT